MSDDHKKKLIKDFQCSGCVGGPDPDTCDSFELQEVDGWCTCSKHVPGTHLMGVRSGLLCLGLPKGFNRVSGHKSKIEPHVRIHTKESYQPQWNRFNVAVWAMEQNGFLFVRTFMPRIDLTVVDVVEGGTLDMVPGAVDVGGFVDQID